MEGSHTLVSNKARKKKCFGGGEPRRWDWEVNSKMRGIFGSSFRELSPPNFLSILRRKLFGGFGEKILGSYYLFSFLSTQPNTFQKSLSSYFFSKIFYQPYFTSKQTHSMCMIKKIKSKKIKNKLLLRPYY